MPGIKCDVLIVGGGVGGCAAAMAACEMGMKVVMTEPTAWVGGQLTSQAVPPDEHPWIEQFGCTWRYRDFRNRVRAHYRDRYPLTAAAKSDPFLNPGGGWVSKLCHEPRVAVNVLQEMLELAARQGQLDVRRAGVGDVVVVGDEIRSLTLDTPDGLIDVEPRLVLDASETGSLLAQAGVEHVVGAESRGETGEPHAVEGPAQPFNQQAITWVASLGWDPKGRTPIERPDDYERWRALAPASWAGPLFSWNVINAGTGDRGVLPLFNPDDAEYELISYRQIANPAIFKETSGPGFGTLVNWPQNDYYERAFIDPESAWLDSSAMVESKELTRSLIYWMQTEAPRHDGGTSYPELYLRPDLTGTDDGFAMAPYVRESRRIKARYTILEQHLSAECNPGRDRAEPVKDSVGVGCYRIDLHPSATGVGIIDFAALPFQIPLGALIPVRMRNLLPACKNLGTTHITNGCYRVHPVEWNIGEAAGALAAFCILRGTEPHAVYESRAMIDEFQAVLRKQYLELEWPELRPV